VQHRLCPFDAAHAGVGKWPEHFRKKTQGGPVLTAEMPAITTALRGPTLSGSGWAAVASRCVVLDVADRLPGNPCAFSTLAGLSRHDEQWMGLRDGCRGRRAGRLQCGHRADAARKERHSAGARAVPPLPHRRIAVAVEQRGHADTRRGRGDRGEAFHGSSPHAGRCARRRPGNHELDCTI